MVQMDQEHNTPSKKSKNYKKRLLNEIKKDPNLNSYNKYKKIINFKNEAQSILHIYDVDLYSQILKQQEQLLSYQKNRALKMRKGIAEDIDGDNQDLSENEKTKLINKIKNNICKCYDIPKDDIYYSNESQPKKVKEYFYIGF